MKMDWMTAYPEEHMPSLRDMEAFIVSPLFKKLCAYLESTYGSAPSIEYSGCSGQTGWNVKYKKGSKALCTLYPMKGYFIALVTVSPKSEPEAELLLPSLSKSLQALFHRTRAMPSMGRWLMIEIHNEELLQDAIRLIQLRIKPPALRGK